MTAKFVQPIVHFEDSLGSVELADALFAAIYNIAAVVPGHSLVIPRRLLESIYELKDAECFRFITFTREVTELLVKSFFSDSFDGTIQQEPAGKTIPHLHHDIRRRAGDLPEPGNWYPMLEEQRHSTHGTKQRIDRSNRPPLDDHVRQEIVGHLRAAVTGTSGLA